MGLEMLVNPDPAARMPWEMFFVGLLYAFVGVFLSLWIFRSQASIVMVFLTVIASLYLIQGTLRREEWKDHALQTSEMRLLKQHWPVLSYFMYLFLGFVVAFSLIYILAPPGLVTSLFSTQMTAIDDVNNVAVSGSAVERSAFLGNIFFNNLKVLFFTFIFAFFYGAGAVFILAWNASVVAAAVGSFVRSEVALITARLGWETAGYFSAYSVGLMKYLTHGSFEILAYFVAALGAGIISIAALHHSFGSDSFRKTLVDSVDLIVISVVLLFVAALIEVFVTPVLF